VKPGPFEYHRPESLDAALELLAQHGDEAKPLAGGQSLIPLLAMRLALPDHVVDLQRIAELRGISVDGAGVRIGAMVSQREVEHHERMPGLVAAAVPHIAHFQIRNRGTVGGSLSHMDPAAEWPALALVLDAVMVAASIRGRREIAARDFVVGPMTTALEPDELLVEVVLPAAEEPFGFAEVERRSGDFALVGAACQGQAVCVFATGPRAQRLERVEEFLRGGGRPGEELQALAASEIEATGDIHASAEYRRQVGASLVGRLVAGLDRSREAPAWS
jgi:aerobic carbon-monoxide dehydrogenase medium subunit